MISLFDIGALSLAALSVLLFKDRSNALIALVCLSLFMLLNSNNAHQLGVYYYLMAMVIDSALLAICTRFYLNLSLSIIFFISILYNALSFIEFNTQFSLIYSYYVPVNKALVIGMLCAVYYNGFAQYGRTNHNHKPDNSPDNISGGGFSARGSL